MSIIITFCFSHSQQVDAAYYYYLQKEIMENEAPSVNECVLNAYNIFVYGAPAGCFEICQQEDRDREFNLLLLSLMNRISTHILCEDDGLG